MPQLFQRIQALPARQPRGVTEIAGVSYDLTLNECLKYRAEAAGLVHQPRLVTQHTSKTSASICRRLLQVGFLVIGQVRRQVILPRCLCELLQGEARCRLGACWLFWSPFFGLDRARSLTNGSAFWGVDLKFGFESHSDWELGLGAGDT